MTNKRLTLNAETRKLTGKKVQNLRETGMIPAVLYGRKIENQNLQVKAGEFEKLLNKISESDLVDLEINGKDSVKILIHNITHHPITGAVEHIDFYQVRMDEKIKTEIEIEFVGESPAVKMFGAILVKALDKIEIECLPGDLISNVEVDLSKLETMDDIIRVENLTLPDNVELLTDPQTTIALVEEPKKEEVYEKPVETVAEVEGEEKKEGDEKPADGDEKPSEKKDEKK